VRAEPLTKRELDCPVKAISEAASRVTLALTDKAPVSDKAVDGRTVTGSGMTKALLLRRVSIVQGDSYEI